MSAKDVAKAVHAARLYHGSMHAGFRVQQKLYERKKKTAEAVRRRTGIENAEEQIAAEATRLGPITPAPGKDY